MASVTLEQVATRVGVSVGTVSRVLNGKSKEVRKDTMERAARIRAVARDLNYRPDAAARAIRKQQSMVVGVIIRNNPAEPFTSVIENSEALLGIGETLERAGYLVSVIRIGEVAKALHNESRIFRERVVDGVIVVGGLSEGAEGRTEELVPSCIWMNCNTWRPQRCIRRDERGAGRLAAEALVSLGYRHLVWYEAVIHSGALHYSGPQRLAGVMEVVNRLGLEIEMVECPRADLYRKPETFDRWFRPNTGIICFNTYSARWLAHTAGSMGLRPAYDFGLACCDDTHDITVQWPGLSRAVFDRFDMGRRAAEMMVAVLENAEAHCPSQLVDVHWCPGNSAWGPQRFDPTPAGVP